MLKWLAKLVRPHSPALTMTDPDFGKISFLPNSRSAATGIWQMHSDWAHPREFARVGCSSIPGTTVGPYPEARAFLLRKRRELPALWALCSPVLDQVRARWPKLPKGVPLKACFVLTSLGLDEPIAEPPSWSVGFESSGDFWVYVEVEILGDRVIGHVCDT